MTVDDETQFQRVRTIMLADSTVGANAEIKNREIDVQNNKRNKTKNKQNKNRK